MPDGGLVHVLGVAGGVGGTITLAGYGSWLREKGWDTRRHMRVMHIDNAMASGTVFLVGFWAAATMSSLVRSGTASALGESRPGEDDGAQHEGDVGGRLVAPLARHPVGVEQPQQRPREVYDAVAGVF